jgi:acyl transferase domain-containing protein/short-subunit dehydrogenase/acyl carrier protein
VVTKKSQKQPIAIVGMGCRYPNNVDSPEKFWQALLNGDNLISDIPEARWSYAKYHSDDEEAPGKLYVNRGAFLSQPLDQFDPGLFGISPRQAKMLDPQQRLLLETVWEAMEDAGLPLQQLQAALTGVYIGAFTTDAQLMQLCNQNYRNINMYTSSSVTMTMISNRISHAFDLCGPSLTVDTACSSSMVAAQIAVNSLRTGDCTIAIVGGINVMILPEVFIGMSKAKFLSKTGQCQAFSQLADGYVRGEGCGVIVLKPLDQALLDNDRIYAVIDEVGANQDGKTTGISLPNSDAQFNLIQKVYREAGVDVNDIVYVEAHGTGTQQGDFAEATALNRIFNKKTEKCLIGSVKTNIGHMEAAAGVSSLIKAALCLNKSMVPPNLHFEHPNEKIFTPEINLRVPVTCEAMPLDGKKHYAGVNSFGYGGTNSHALLSNYVREKSKKSHPGAHWPVLIPVSGHSAAVRDQRLQDLGELLASSNDFDDVYYTLAQRRTHLDYRSMIFSTSHAELQATLATYLAGEATANVIVSSKAISQGNTKLAFVYTGMGPQWWGMGKDLVTQSAVFKQVLAQCEQIFRKLSGWSITEEFLKSEQESSVSRAEIAQPLNFVLQVGLTKVLEAWGIVPEAVIGHSVGEIAAAYVSGALSLEDALTVTYYRSKLQQSCAGMGSMLAVNVSKAKASALIKPYPKLSIAAVNSENAVTIAGDVAELDALSAELKSTTIFNRRLTVDIPFHSQYMEPIKAELMSVLQAINPKKSSIPFYSTVMPGIVCGSTLDNAYWWRNVRESVLFCEGVQCLVQDDFNVLLEVGPHPVTRHYLEEISDSVNKTTTVFSTLNRKDPQMQCLYQSIASMFNFGLNLDWGQKVSAQAGLVTLPNYPWMRESYWLEEDNTWSNRYVSSPYPFISTRVDSPNQCYEVEFNTHFFPYTPDHIVNGNLVFPGTSYIEAALEICRHSYNSDKVVIEALAFKNMLTYDSSNCRIINVEYDMKDSALVVRSRDANKQYSHWLTHATATVLPLEGSARNYTPIWEQLKRECQTQVELGELYHVLEKIGLVYKGRFKCIKTLLHSEKNVLARLELNHYPESQSEFILHPALLDSAFQTAIVLANELSSSTPFVPVSVDKICYYGKVVGACNSHSTLKHYGTNKIKQDIVLFDDDGNVLVEVHGLLCQKIENVSQRLQSDTAALCYHWDWVQEETPIEKPAALTHKVYVITTSEQAKFLQLLDAHAIDAVPYVCADPEQPSFDALQARIEKETNDVDPVFIVFLIDNQSYEDQEEQAYPFMLNTCQQYTLLARMFAALSHKNFAFRLITHNAHSMQGDVGSNLGASPFAQLTTLIQNESENMNGKAIDLPEAELERSADLLLAELFTLNTITDVVIRDAKKYVQRLTPLGKLKPTLAVTVAPSTSNLTYSNGHFELKQQARLDAGAIRVVNELVTIIPVRYDRTSKHTHCLYEYKSTVTQLGTAVTRLQLGDTVVHVADSRLETCSVLRAEQVLLAGSIEDASLSSPCLPTLFASYVLKNYIHHPSETSILINNADTLMGMALCTALLSQGARVSVVLNSEQNKTLFDSFKVDAIFYADVTQPLGADDDISFDMIINGYAQDLAHLCPYVKDRTTVINYVPALKNTQLVNEKGLSLHTISWQSVLSRLPSLLQELRLDTPSGATNDDFVPTIVYEPDEIQECTANVDSNASLARYQIDFFDKKIDFSTYEMSLDDFADDESYLITGGCSGFGLELAKWLVAKNVGQIVLLSRSGPKTYYDRKIIETLGRKVDLKVVKCDVSDRQQLKTVIDDLSSSPFKFSGVFHCAMVLDDGFIVNMTPERYQRVMKPKVIGAVNLHQLTKSIPLKYFVTTSSIATVMGNPGQANYIAANAFLEAFNRYRLTRNLPSTTINIGVLSDVGVIANDENLNKYVDLLAIQKTPSEQIIEALEYMLLSKIEHACVFDIDWQKWFQVDAKSAQNSRFSLLYDKYKSGGYQDDGVNQELLALLGDDKKEAMQIIASLLADEVSAILQCSAETIIHDKSLIDYGIDSLMISELRNVLITKFNIKVSLVELLNNTSICSMSALVSDKIFSQGSE